MQEILKRLEDKVNQIDQRFSQMDQRFDQIDQRFNGVDAELHRHGVLLEAIGSDLKQTMETVTGNRQVLDDKFAEVLRKLDERVQPVELASRHFARELSAAREGKRTRRK